MQRGFAVDAGIFCMNIFSAVASLISFEELKASFKTVCRDLRCHSVSSPGCIPPSTFICAPEHWFWARLGRRCYPRFLGCVLAYMPESRSFIAADCLLSSLCLLSVSTVQISVGWTLSRTADDRLDGLGQTSSPRLGDAMLHLQK